MLDLYRVNSLTEVVLEDGAISCFDESDFVVGMDIEEFHAIKNAIQRKAHVDIGISYFADAVVDESQMALIHRTLQDIDEEDLSALEASGRRKLLLGTGKSESKTKLIVICD